MLLDMRMYSIKNIKNYENDENDENISHFGIQEILISQTTFSSLFSYLSLEVGPSTKPGHKIWMGKRDKSRTRTKTNVTTCSNTDVLDNYTNKLFLFLACAPLNIIQILSKFIELLILIVLFLLNATIHTAIRITILGKRSKRLVRLIIISIILKTYDAISRCYDLTIEDIVWNIFSTIIACVTLIQWLVSFSIILPLVESWTREFQHEYYSYVNPGKPFYNFKDISTITSLFSFVLYVTASYALLIVLLIITRNVN